MNYEGQKDNVREAIKAIERVFLDSSLQTNDFKQVGGRRNSLVKFVNWKHNRSS